MQIRSINYFFQFISFLIFLASLTQPGFYTEGGRPTEAGPAGWLLVIGWLGYVDNIFAWYANPLLAVAWIVALLNVRRGAILVLPIALTLALSFLLHQEIMNNEAGGHAKIIGYGTGYWLWIASIAVALLGNVFTEVISIAWPWRTSTEVPLKETTAESPFRTHPHATCDTPINPGKFAKVSHRGFGEVSERRMSHVACRTGG